MAEYWKSTPTYWCKFCSVYVKDTPLERRNHETSGKHQGNIQRNLRDLHRGKEREEREKQRAKDEVARLNGLVDGKGGKREGAGVMNEVPKVEARRATAAPPVVLTPAQQRKAHAEQLAALGVVLPEELKREVQGVGSYHVVSAKTVENENPVGTQDRSLAEILAEARAINAPTKDEPEEEDDDDGERKRKFEDVSDEEGEGKARKRKNWGTDIKSYPGVAAADAGGEDLDALLSGVKKKESPVKAEGGQAVKTEDDTKSEEKDEKPLAAIPAIDDAPGGSAPAVAFKKRKGKK